MTAILAEYLLKGLFLALWAYWAVVQNHDAPDVPRFLRTVIWTVGGLGVGVLAGAVNQIRRGVRPAANPLGFLIVVLIDSPFWIYLGVVGGLGLGLGLEYDPPADRDWLTYFAIGGLVLGYGFSQLRDVKDWMWRFGIAAVIGAGLVFAGMTYAPQVPGLTAYLGTPLFVGQLAFGVFFFYLLTFCGEADESEVEIAALCAALGLGLYFLLAGGASLLGDKAIFLAPLTLYFVYVTRWMPGLQTFKHTLRGYTHLHTGRSLEAVIAFKKALQRSPGNPLATEGLWKVHQKVDVTKLPPDAELLKFLDYEFCLNQAAGYLFGHTPTADDREKAGRMLDLVERQRPQLAARVDYLRAVLLTHAKQFDAAAGVLSKLLDPAAPYETKPRNGVLFPAWYLALRLHPELAKRLGDAELTKPGRRMQAIAAAERQSAAEPNDPAAAELKQHLYAGLSEAEFAADAAGGPPTDFNYDHVEQLGLALVDEPDPARRDRGAAYLRIAGRGLPHRGPGIFTKLAAVADQLGDAAAAHGYREQVKRSGLTAGIKNLAADQRAVYFDTLKRLAADAEARGDFPAAVDDLRLTLESGKAELEIYRKLADLYEKNKDSLNALLMVETALVYSKKDPDLLARKDRYYYSVEPDRLAAVREKVEPFFDTAYCSRKAKQILDGKDADLDMVDWALHLAKLARVMTPTANAARYAEARALLRKGEKDAALAILEDLREGTPGSGDEEDTYYQGTKMLAELYVNDYQRPDLAVQCYLAYRDYPKSGADTHFRIGECYEAMNEPAKALQSYETVTAYDQHPRYWEATEKVRQLKGKV